MRKHKLQTTNYKPSTAFGFTFVEVLVSLAVLGIIIALSVSAFSRFNKRQELNVAVRDVRSVFEEARSLTLASKDDTVYGVHLNTTQVVLFVGSTYESASPDNKMAILPPRVHIATTSLSGGNDVVFERVTGKTQNSGTVTLAFISDSAASTTITIYESGLVE